MNPEVAQAALYWLAGSMHVWVPTVVMVLAGVIIGLLHLVAIAVADR